MPDLTFVKQFMWKMAHSDPYAAYCYDLLHSDDLGLWGKHLFEFLLEVLAKLKRKGDLNRKYVRIIPSACTRSDYFCESMAQMPRWPGLKHFYSLTTTDLRDGNQYLAIMKVCLLQFFCSRPTHDLHSLFSPPPSISSHTTHLSSMLCARLSRSV